MELQKGSCPRSYCNAYWWCHFGCYWSFSVPYILWNKIWEIHGDPNTQLFLDDPVSDCLMPLHFLDRIPYYHATIQEFKVLEYFESSDEDDNGSSDAPSSPSGRVNVPSPSVIHCAESLIKARTIILVV